MTEIQTGERIAKLEQKVTDLDKKIGDVGAERVAKLEQKVVDLTQRVGDMGAVAVAVGVLTERVSGVGDDVRVLGVKLQNEIDFRSKKDEETSKDRRQVRIALWGFTVSILCALVSAGVILLTYTGK